MRVIRWGVRALAGVVLLLAAGVGAITARTFMEAKRQVTSGAEYVALGSSFAAGPGIGSRAPASPSLCMRSSLNYPRLLAERRGLTLTDVSCSGATTHHVLAGGQYFLPPQVDAIDATTQLVTITIGGNDVAYVGNLSGWSCRNARARVPRAWRLVACPIMPETEVNAAFEALAERMHAIVRAVRQRAPGATVAFVDYVTIVPERGACPERLPLSELELDRARAVAARLEHITAEVARESGSLLVRASELTQGHDVCAAEPWVFGYDFPATPLAYGPLFYHPTDAAMRRVAEALDRELRVQP